jgi:hypothetical protein
VVVERDVGRGLTVAVGLPSRRSLSAALHNSVELQIERLADEAIQQNAAKKR